MYIYTGRTKTEATRPNSKTKRSSRTAINPGKQRKIPTKQRTSETKTGKKETTNRTRKK